MAAEDRETFPCRAPGSVPWGIGQAVLLLLACQFLMAGGVLLGLSRGGLSGQMLYAAAADAVVFGLLLAFAAMRSGGPKDAMRHLGLVGPASGTGGKAFKLAAVALLVYGAVVFGKLRLVEALGLEELPLQQVSRAVMQTDSTFDLACATVVVVVLAPLMEETLFRSVLYLPLRSRLGILPAALIVALVFAAFHGYLWGVVDLVLLSLIFTAFFEVTGSLPVAMAAHGLFNGVSMLLLRLASEAV